MRVKIFLLLTILCYLFLSNVVNAAITTIKPGINIYSEYYPNLSAKFKGTIIFENGSGADLTEWKANQTFFNCVRNIGSVFLYDRGGLGKSPADVHFSTYHPLTAEIVSDKLFSLLHKLNISPPYLFIAHSYGALYAGYFTLKNPSIVKGLFLVDPVPRNFVFTNKIMQKYKGGLEDANNHSESKRSLQQLGEINDNIPVIIISSTGMEKEQPLLQDWYSSQKQWLNNNSLSKIMQVSSGHFIQLQQPQKVCSELVKITSRTN